VGLPVSLILIAVGAILTFAVNDNPNRSVDLDAVGWILMAVGLLGLLLSLFWWERFGPGAWGWHRAGYAYDDAPPPRGYRGYGRRRTIVEDEGPVAPGPPGPPGPPDAPPPP
jgi:Domain of unknown function (DUF6458)